MYNLERILPMQTIKEKDKLQTIYLPYMSYIFITLSGSLVALIKNNRFFFIKYSIPKNSFISV